MITKPSCTRYFNPEWVFNIIMETPPSTELNKFPYQKIQEINELINKSILFDTKNKFSSTELLRAVHGFKSRYISLQYQEKRYQDITLEYGDLPTSEPDYRFLQDEAIFFFFTCSLSLFDCYAYALYATCSHLDPKILLNNFSDGKIYFHTILKQKPVSNFLQNAPLFYIITNVENDIKYKNIQTFRNYLNHRAHLPRTAYLSTNNHINSRFNTIDGLDVEINNKTLHEYKSWIDTSINDLLNEFHSFLTKNFY